jgi:7,8-dihydropterin-6-yl-methyl-4-(beta-D-ribofuranosyl)aminobenzene 5'-phosphate synthase
MKNSVKITTIVENTARGKNITSEHGLSFFIETGGEKIIFDTGQGLSFVKNAGILGLNLAQASSIVLSHGHYDHTGGLVKATRITPEAKIFAHPDALISRYSKHKDGSIHEIGMPGDAKEKMFANTSVTLNEGPTEIPGGLKLTGTIPRLTDFEDTGGDFYKDLECTEKDSINDDQAGYVETPRGTVVILGCAHSGIINTINYIKKLTGGKKIYAVAGGMHLVNAGPERITKTVEELRILNIKILAPGHCAGFKPSAILFAEFPEIFAPCNTGTVLEI